MYEVPSGDFKTISGIKDKDLNNLIGNIKGNKDISRADKVNLI